MLKRLVKLMFLCCIVPVVGGHIRGAEAPMAAAINEADWPCWRGFHGDGSAANDPGVPIEWTDTKNIAWEMPIPGRGHGSPIVVGDQVVITSADGETRQQTVHCFDRRTGSELWQTVVHEGGFARKMNLKATLASTTPACDGERFIVNFLNDGAVYTTALSRNGEQLWQTKISDYVIHQGYGSSPTIHDSLVIVTADNKGGGAVAALSRKDGHVVWRHSRPEKPNYSSPVVIHADGRDQLILTGCDLVQSYEPVTGKLLWEVEGATTECVTSTVSDGSVVFSSGGYPRNHIGAYLTDGSGQVAWEDTTRVYVPSMLLRDGTLFGVADGGIAFCRRSDNGDELWQGRLSGTFTSSPVIVGNRIYATNEDGLTFVFSSGTKQFKLLNRNQLGEEVYATPAVSRGCLFQRIARKENDSRQEYIVCIGQP
jgi:outer membrane protein assembly factor BamB